MRVYKYLLFMLILMMSVSMKGQYNPTNPAEPGIYYTLKLGVTPSNSGRFNINSETTYSEGTSVSLRAYPESNYTFVAWEEEGRVLSTTTSFNYQMPAKDVTLIARFEYNPSNPSEPEVPEYSTLYLESNPASAGYFNISSGNKYEVGSTVSLRAYNNSNYSFENWTEDGEIISTSYSFVYVMKAGNPKLVANFSYNPSSPDEPSEARLYHKLFLDSTPSDGGYFNVSSGNEYQENSTVNLRAYSNQFYAFKYWTERDSIISSQYNFNYIMPTHDAHLHAHYEYFPSNPNEPDPSLTDEIHMYGMTENGVRGQTILFPIYLENNQDVNGAIVDIQFPKGFRANTTTIIIASRAEGHSLDVSDLGDNSYRISLTGNTPFDSDNGKLYEIPVTIPDTARMGYNYTVRLYHGVMVGSDNSQAPITVRDGNIYIEKISEDGLYAKYSYDKLQGRVKFTNLSSGKALNYIWDFGDGSTSTEKNPLHVFGQPGYYNVRLTAKGEVDEDIAEMTILINDKSTWKVDGAFYLSDEINGVRYFDSAESLFAFMSDSPITGNIQISVKGDGQYFCPLSSQNIINLKTIQTALAQKDLTLSFAKLGSGRNPVLCFGDQNATVDPEVVSVFISLGANLICEGVETQLWGTSFDAAKIGKIIDQTIHSGEKSAEVDFSSISTDLIFTWTLAEAYTGVTGYVSTGTRTIPSMKIINEEEGNRTLLYNIVGTREGIKFCSFVHRITVTPALVGIFTSLTPTNGSVLDATSVSLSWNSITNAVYDVYLWNAKNQRPQTPVLAGSTDLRYTSTGFCQFGNTYKWQVVARNESQSLESDTLSFSIQSLPDLHVYALDCSTPKAGENLTISWTVKNDGTGSTGEKRWNDYVWLVTDVYAGTINGTSSNHATLLATVPNVKALESGESYDNSIEIKLAERVYGNYYLLIGSDMYSITDIRWNTIGGSVVNPYNPTQEGDGYKHLYATTTASYNLIDERDEYPTLSDNFFYKKIEIAVQDLADLQIPEITASVLPSMSPYSDAANSSGNKEKYDFSWEPSPLTAAGLRSSTMPYSGKRYAINVKIANKGTVDSEKSFRTVLYMSHSADRETSELHTIGTLSYYGNIASQKDTIISLSIDMPYDWYGETYFHAYADIDDNVYELANTQNNWGVSSKYDILLCPGADFVPTNLSVPSSITSSNSFNVSYSVVNQGAGIPYSNNWKDKTYISTNKEKLDDKAILLHTNSINGGFRYNGSDENTGNNSPEDYVYSGDNYERNVSISPTNLAGGTYYVYVKIDADDNVFEFDGENNNVLRSNPITLTFVEPDLSVELLSLSEDTLASNMEVALAWKLKNLGTGDIKDVRIKDEFYASVNMDGSGGTKIATVENSVWIAAGSEKTLHANVTIPSINELNGLRYVYVKTNVDGNLNEISTTNNKSNLVKSWFKYSPSSTVGANLSLQSISVSNKVKPGAIASIDLTITNNGDADLANIEVQKEVFISTSRQSFVDNMTKCEVTSASGTVAKLKAGESKKITLQFKVPANIKGGLTYVYVYLDRDNQLAEKNTSDNSISSTFYIDGNLPDLAISDVVIADTLMTSDDITLKFKITNLGDWDAQTSNTLVYLSTNATNTYSATTLASLSIPSITKNGEIDETVTFSIPDKNAGKWYILLHADAHGNNDELNENNNKTAIPVTVLQSPLPDLTVVSINTDVTLSTGQPLTISTTIANKGKNATRSNKWTESFYLSSSAVLNPDNAILLGSKTHVGYLDVNSSYTCEATYNIPSNVQGNYMLFVLTDATDAICEDDENNNTMRVPVYINGAVDTPADIAISNLEAPSSIKAGEEISISYDLSNEGDYIASGELNDVIYLSKDKKWDKDDVMVGVVTGPITINPGSTVTRSITGRITNMPEGNYHFIVKTNSTKTIAEKTEDNNTAIMTTSSKLSFTNLTLGNTVQLTNSGYYKLAISSGYEGKTIGFYLDHSEDANVGLYAAYESVPSTAKSDFISSSLIETQQEVLIPNVKAGNYYILAQDNGVMINSSSNTFTVDNSSSIDSNSSMSLSTREIEFGATTLSINEGGNGGWVSTDINGALFDSIMDFRLKMDEEVIPAEMVAFNGRTRSRVTFNLNNAETGLYDVVSELPDGTQATLPNGFRVIPGTNVNLGIKLDVPSVVRVGNYAPFSISYANGGNTNIEIYGLVVALDNGYLATTIQGLDKHESNINLDLDIEGDSRGYMSIPPGTQKTINLFMYQTVATSNMIVYIIK